MILIMICSIRQRLDEQVTDQTIRTVYNGGAVLAAINADMYTLALNSQGDVGRDIIRTKPGTRKLFITIDDDGDTAPSTFKLYFTGTVVFAGSRFLVPAGQITLDDGTSPIQLGIVQPHTDLAVTPAWAIRVARDDEVATVKLNSEEAMVRFTMIIIVI